MVLSVLILNEVINTITNYLINLSMSDIQSKRCFPKQRMYYSIDDNKKTFA